MDIEQHGANEWVAFAADAFAGLAKIAAGIVVGFAISTVLFHALIVQLSEAQRRILWATWDTMSTVVGWIFRKRRQTDKRQAREKAPPEEEDSLVTSDVDSTPLSQLRRQVGTTPKLADFMNSALARKRVTKAATRRRPKTSEAGARQAEAAGEQAARSADDGEGQDANEEFYRKSMQRLAKLEDNWAARPAGTTNSAGGADNDENATAATARRLAEIEASVARTGAHIEARVEANLSELAKSVAQLTAAVGAAPRQTQEEPIHSATGDAFGQEAAAQPDVEFGAPRTTQTRYTKTFARESATTKTVLKPDKFESGGDLRIWWRRFREFASGSGVTPRDISVVHGGLGHAKGGKSCHGANVRLLRRGLRRSASSTNAERHKRVANRG